MKRSMILGAVTVLVALGAFAIRAAEKPAAGDGHAAHFEKCSKVCANCQTECEKNFHHCFMLVAAGQKEHAKAAQLSGDCAEFCGLSAKLTARHSPLAGPACEACIKSCEACAVECEKFADSKEMQACAKTCRDCIKSCQEMLKHVGHAK